MSSIHVQKTRHTGNTSQRIYGALISIYCLPRYSAAILKVDKSILSYPVSYILYPVSCFLLNIKKLILSYPILFGLSKTRIKKEQNEHVHRKFPIWRKIIHVYCLYKGNK